MTVHDDRLPPPTPKQQTELTRLRSLQADPRYHDPVHYDPKYVAEVDRAYEKSFGK